MYVCCCKTTVTKSMLYSPVGATKYSIFKTPSMNKRLVGIRTIGGPSSDDKVGFLSDWPCD